MGSFGEQETILIVDDAEINRALLRNLFERDYNLLEAENGEQALMLLRQYSETIIAVLLDLVMPEKDGYEVLAEMRRARLLYHAPVVVITADDTTDNQVRVFELGASDIIAKPFKPEVVKSRVKNIIELGRYRRRLEALVEEQAMKMQESNAAVIDMLSSVIEYRSLESGQHIRRIRMFTKILLEDVAKNYQEYNLDEHKIRLITDASSMHDIGKIAIPDSILNKPGRLTSEEFEVMKTHTVKGCEILSGLDRLQDREYLQYAYQICRYHHERWDGNGYPDGLKGSSIPICAQVVAIADCYDALTTDRVYKKAISPSQAFSMILNGECGAFSPRLLECFKNVQDSFAKLSGQYADGLSVEDPQKMQTALEAPLWDLDENVAEQSQLKYFALLRYLDATVMEVDFDTGIYHLVYQQDQDFAALGLGNCLAESIKNFADAVVHPEDREEVLCLSGSCMQEFFDEGLSWREYRYRVQDCQEGDYVWCRTDLLRINSENPRLRRCLLVWHKEEKAAEALFRDDMGYKQEMVFEQLFGGIQKIRCDGSLTMLQTSKRLTSMLGYSEQELSEQFHNHLLDLIYTADREKVLAQFRSQRDAGRMLELEYRLTTKDGSIVWALNRCMVTQEDGVEVAFGVLLDITQSRQAEEELRLSLERHNIIMAQTNDILFEWDIEKDALFLPASWETQYGYAPIKKNMREEVLKASHIHPDDLSDFVSLIDAMEAGVLYKEAEFRIADESGTYRWRKVRATAQFDLDGRPSKAVGIIVDIDAQKRDLMKMEEQAARDRLTGLYNLTAARSRIEEYLSSCEPDNLAALMVLDIDNFSQVNERYGHVFGDAVLVEVSKKIAGLYRIEDTVARVEGDEFLVFMTNLREERVAGLRAGKMIDILRELLKEDSVDVVFSSSIGIAFARGGSLDFEELYGQARQALAFAKESGKNRYEIWQQNPKELKIIEQNSAKTAAAESNLTEHSPADQDLLSQERIRQALQYDHLFQSVLCGIVQYHLVGKDVVFKKANREAIRIFGYQQEDFWAKRDWDLSALIALEDREAILAEVSTLQKVGDKSNYEYRLLQKDGNVCWIIGSAEMILDGDGDQVIQSVFLDIDAKKKAELHSRRLAEQVEASNEILHLALEHTATCEFYYYPHTKECVVPARTCAFYQCREHYYDMPRSFAEDLVDESCHPAFYEMYDRIFRGEKTASCEFKGKTGHFWCRVTLSVILGREEGPDKHQLVVGIVEDITRQRDVEDALEAARSQDNLTGLYNKESGIRLVQEYLESGREPGEDCALMLLDMDDFEDVNQKEGSVFADVILLEVADILRAEAGPDSIPVRLGGDEFMLLIKRCDKARAKVIGPRIAGLVKNVMANSEKEIHVSVSIGMCSTEVVQEYNGLYRCAESTLKYVKEHGKGQAACYLDTSNELGTFLTQVYTEEHAVSAIDRDTVYQGDDLISFALDLLGKAKNINDAVLLLLSRIGKTYHLDRVSILEANRAFLTYHFSYQWARNRADLQMNQEFYVTEEEFDACANMYDEDGLADRNIRDGISRIASCLHAGIWDYGEYAGSMSFEIDQENYAWTEEQRKLLKELVKIVPSFIMKSKADAVSQAKTDFLSRMSHEIRTPMNAISGMTTIAKSVLEDRDKALECLNKIESANNYLLALINDILDMSRIESGKLELSYEPVDLAELMNSLEDLFCVQAAQKGLKLGFEYRVNERQLLMADGLRLNQVLVNIIGNAIKFTDRGGVLVKVEELPTEPSAGEETNTKQTVAIRFSVLDTGIGIDPAHTARIFNAFEQEQANTAAHYGGTGLGLSISSRLVQMMGGSLEVRSQVGQGSEFYFTLPFSYADESLEAPEKRLASEEACFEGRSILLAEDNELNREIAQTILEMNGFVVTCARDGLETLEIFCSGEPGRFDAILMDIRMPVMDGLESARRIRTSGRPDARTIPIIALTANAFDEDTKKSIESGMDGHLSKPLQVEQMLDLLGRCMGKRAADC